MTDKEQRKNAKEFSDYWKDKGYEKGESQKFWLAFLRDVFGVEHPEAYISFEDKVFLGNTSFIDGYISDTKVLIEQKSLGKDLKTPIRQSDGALLSPFQQAKRYISELPLSKHPRWVITCNFSTFLVYDMENPSGEPEEILLENLEKEYYRLSFLVSTENVHLEREKTISLQAGELVGEIFKAFAKQYDNFDDEYSQKSLNKLCVRLVFCLYAEDAGIFGKHSMFHDYLNRFETRDMRKALIELFKVLDQNPEKGERDKYLDKDLAEFPYVNGGLFSDENIEIPPFTDEIRDLLLNKASADFDWSEISPTIFGAVFESTLNPEKRREAGMHYTSIENIHKVIDPLFLDGLKKELQEISEIKTLKTREAKLKEFQEKLASLKFLDPACGSGNFLTETYISLRRLENEVLSILSGKTMYIGFGNLNPIKVSISQFYGIEYNDFAVTVAQTALWIAESQMLKETETIIMTDLEFLPLRSYANITEGNALLIKWNEIISSNELFYIMGNPPFNGGMYMQERQKKEITELFSDLKGAGEIDYVCGWYKKAAEFIKGSNIRVALVSTNSICQGEHVLTFWKYMLSNYGIKIDFAYTTFVWNSEAKDKAKVHCVIVGFSNNSTATEKRLYGAENRYKICKNINPYLVDADNFFIDIRSNPLCDVPPIRFGSMPRDGGGFVLSPEEREEFIKKEPLSEKWIKPYIGAVEFLNNKERYCLWLLNAEPSDLDKCPMVKERIKFVKDFRASSKAAATRKFAETPTVFCQIAQPDSEYILVPETSSGKRRYLPLGFENKDTIASNLVFLIPNATLYEFGVLMSNVHNAWLRQVAGRLKSDYRYSKDIVYNNFPWPTPNDEQRAKIIETAQGILDARALHTTSTLAQLYNDDLMPNDLRKAHQENDRAVMSAYGLSIKETTESSCVAFLISKYKELVD